MFRKLLALVCLWWLITVYFSCCPDKPYYAYSSIDLTVARTQIELSDSLVLFLSPQITGYVASLNPGLTMQAVAWSCLQGEKGPKFPPVLFDITTVYDFDDDHPAGSSVVDVFWVKYYRDYTEAHVSVTDLTELRYLFQSHIYTKARPTASTAHQFNISLRNSKEDAFEFETPMITWL